MKLTLKSSAFEFKSNCGYFGAGEAPSDNLEIRQPIVLPNRTESMIELCFKSVRDQRFSEYNREVKLMTKCCDYDLLVICVAVWLGAVAARADCTLTNLGITPLNELGLNSYKGVGAGLYPNSANSRPP